MTIRFSRCLQLLQIAVVAAAAWLPANQAARAADYFVAKDGHDSAAGTADAPWLTLQHAAEEVAPGDRVTVRQGSYTGFYLETSGEPGSPIQFLAQPGVVINAPNDTTPDGINLEGASYVVIDGFEVANMPRTGVRTVGLPTNFAKFVTIRNVYAHDNTRWGILTGHVDDLLIENNRMTGSVLEHGIYVSNSGDRPIVRGNITSGNYRAGIQLNADLSQGGPNVVDGIISGAVISGNIIFGNGAGGGSAINLDGVQNSRIENNLLYDNHASGISLFRQDGAAGSSGNTVINNTIQEASDARWAINIQNASTGDTLRNNILINDHATHGAIDISADSLSGFSSDYNVVNAGFTTTGSSTGQPLNQWQAATGQDLHSFLATKASLFVNAAAGNFQLLGAAVANNAGLAAGAPATDLNGRPRPYGPGVDIGALERILPGDYNADGLVNATDYTVWRNTLGSSVAFGASADGDLDGHVTAADYVVWKSQFGQAAGSGAAATRSPNISAVPEPGTWFGFTLTLAWLVMKRLCTMNG